MSATDRADPTDVDKEPVMALGECPNCGPRSLTTVKVEDAEYIASCGSCDHELRAPVIETEDGEHKVAFDREEQSEEAGDQDAG